MTTWFHIMGSKSIILSTLADNEQPDDDLSRFPSLRGAGAGAGDRGIGANQVSGAASKSFVLRPWIVVGGLCVLYLLIILLVYRNGLRELIWPTPSGQPGYDGQFTYA